MRHSFYEKVSKLLHSTGGKHEPIFHVTKHYTELMRERYQKNQAAFLEALQSDALIVCCYCKDTHASARQCHRYLLVDILHKVADRHQIGFKSLGEVQNRR